MAAMDNVQIHELLAQAEKRLEGNDTAVAAVDNDLDKTQPVAPVAAAVPKTVDGSVRLAQNGHKNNKTAKVRLHHSSPLVMTPNPFDGDEKLPLTAS